ncbi:MULTISPECIES: CPBP family intramembrane glutamic endopeptidase [Hyphomonas]|uniref:CPBP family intramembrane glutamic endopeptidase n=1 Tax=Hyphomonas TaxID=85 RepID=UPI002352D5EE|nr:MULTISPECIES: CPBP family intramembrane glutamic endopeptidase [Hyphomonas]
MTRLRSMVWTAIIIAVAYQFFVILPAIVVHGMMPDMSIIVLSGIANVLTVMAVYGYLKVQGVADEVAEPGDMNLIVVLIAVAAAIVAIALTTFLAGLLATMFGPQGLSVSDGFTHQLQTASRAELFFTIVLVAPFAEEFIYRGLVMGVLLARGWAPLPAAGLSAVIFALQHIQYGWIGILVVLVYGVMLGLLRVASGGLFLPIMAHFFINLISLTM